MKIARLGLIVATLSFALLSACTSTKTSTTPSAKSCKSCCAAGQSK